VGFPCFVSDASFAGVSQFTTPARRLGNVLRFWSGSTRGNEKICATRWSPIFCSAQPFYRAHSPPKPGHISQSPRSSLGYLKWNPRWFGCGRNQRVMTFAVVDDATGARATLTQFDLRVLQHETSRHRSSWQIMWSAIGIYALSRLDLERLRRACQLVEQPTADPHGGWCWGATVRSRYLSD
jgi:hypothetical protein